MAGTSMRGQQKYGIIPERIHWSVFQRIALLPCFSCGIEPAEGVDHVIPFCQTGRNVVENLQPSCLPCNKRKGGSENA